MMLKFFWQPKNNFNFKFTNRKLLKFRNTSL